MTARPIARRALFTAALALTLGGCALRRRRPVPPAPPLKFIVGDPYQADGVWRYPRARFDDEETGLAAEIGAHAPFMTDGAPYDQTALLGAHPTLQLPCVARVTNLESGVSLLVRLDDRGPAAPGRALALSPRAWTLLGAGSEPGVLRVRVQVEQATSLALANSLAADRDRIALTAAPIASVTEQALPPPEGAAGPTALPGAAAPPPALAQAPPAAAVPLRLPEQLTQYPVAATSLFVDLGGFSTPRYARVLAARMAGLGARMDTASTAPRDQAFRVRIGPLASAAEADAALDRTLAAGVSGARIVVDEE